MTDNTIHLPIVFHFHQPIDNFPWVIEDAFKKAYGPLIENIFNYPDIKVTFHFSGNLLEWFINHKPNIIKKLKDMAKRGQIELIGGGYYEPIFAIIPYRDKIAQIKKLSDLINNEFGLEVKGAWLSERVWEPNYPSFLNDAGLKYVIVDDNHFRSTGIIEEDTFYSYVTEDEGKTLRVFSINEKLRYLTPWKPTYYSIDYLKKHADEKGDKIALLISDAEKMGVWGSTHEFCYIEGKGHQEGDGGKPFISAFFQQIINNEWIKSITLTEYMEKFPAKGLVYIPTASYDKMEEWVLLTPIRTRFKKIRKSLKEDPDKQDEYLFLKGGFWRYFLVKYPESNNMHKKMLLIREKLIQTENQIRTLKSKDQITKYNSKIEQAWDEIYKAQCNDCYWHGLFGGVYLQFLRFSVYTHLLNAEKIIDDLFSDINKIPNEYMSILPIDFNKDSKMDIIVESNILNLYINPDDGGTIFELDYKPKSYNLLNILTRWPEAYHDSEKINQEEVMVDRFRRSILRVRFFENDTSLTQLESDTYHEFGTFCDGKFEITKNIKDGKSAIIELELTGTVKDTNSHENCLCSVFKRIKVEKNTVDIFIKVDFKKEPGKESILANILEKLCMGIDIPFFFNGDPSKFRWESNQVLFINKKESDLLKPFEYDGFHFKAFDESYDLNFEFEIASELKSNLDTVKIIKFPIIAYAYTDEGYKKIYQGINLISKFILKRKQEYHLRLTIF
ncbi:MAG: alpha-amylase/4-alpha-glucanotransferase domain-containing protein [Candidatus Heimdallarchaeota archaeon]